MTPFKRRDSYFINKEQLGEEIANLQELVQDMKDGFTGAMQELARIQSGDQMMRSTIDRNRTECEKEIAGVKGEIAQLKDEVHRAVEDFRICQRTMEELQTEIAKLRESNEAKQDQLSHKSNVTSAHDDTPPSLPSTEKSNEQSYDTGTIFARRPTLPRVSPMLQTFIESLSNPNGCTKPPSRAFLNDVNHHQTEVSGSSPSLTNNSKTTLTTFQDVTETPHQFRPDIEDRRLQLAHELLDNEAQYQTDLRFLIENIRERLLQSDFISSDDVKIIFPAFLSSIREKHCEVLDAINKRIRAWNQHNTLGDIYARITASSEKLMEKYRQYIRGFPASVSTFSHHLKTSPEFASFIRETIVSHCPGYSNPNRIMFAPLHRIPYYVQHIKRLQECTDENHPDQYHLASSLKQLKQFVKKINQLVKQSKPEKNTARSNSSSEQPEGLSGDNNHVSGSEKAKLIVTSSTITAREQKTDNGYETGNSFNSDVNDSQTEEDRSTDSYTHELKLSGMKDAQVAGRRTGRRRSLSAYMLEIPEEPNDVPRLGRSLSPSRLEQLRLEESARESVAESSDNDSHDGDAESGAAMSSKDGDASHDTTSCPGDDLSQEELELIGKPLVNKQVYLALESDNTPQRAPSFGVYGDLDWKGEGGEYVPSAIEMNFPSNQKQSQNRWKNNPAFQLTRQQSEKTESEYHTSDDEPIPINSPLYDEPVSGHPMRGMEKRRRSSLGELTVIPPRQEDNSFCIQWENIDTTSDEDDRFLSGGEKTVDVFKAVSSQRKKFGMRRRSIDASDPSIRCPVVGGGGPVATPRESWTEDETGQQPSHSPQSLGDKIKHPLKNVLKRVTSNNDVKVPRSDDVNTDPPDVMQQLAEIARMIVESSESPTKNKDPCSDV